MKFRSISIAVTMLLSLSLFGIPYKSDAFEITYFYVYADTDYGSGANATAYVNTDEDIVCIQWFVDDVYSHTTHYGAGTRFASEIFRFTGHIKGNKHKITAEAWLDPDVCMPATPKSDTFRVYKPIYLRQQGENTGARGYVEISSFYYDGSHIIMSSYAYARNPINNPKAQDPDENPLQVLAWFRTQEYPAPDGAAGNEHRDTKDPEIIKVGKVSKTYTPGPFTDPQAWAGGGAPFDRHVGSLKGRTVYYNAHTHLTVSTTKGRAIPADHWEVDTREQTDTAAVTFTGADGP